MKSVWDIQNMLVGMGRQRVSLPSPSSSMLRTAVSQGKRCGGTDANYARLNYSTFLWQKLESLMYLGKIMCILPGTPAKYLPFF